MQPADEFLDVALDAARAAAEVLRRHFARLPAARLKADGSPVTEADLEAEAVIRETLTRAFPAHGFYGEETGADRADAEFVWYVDPLDGTRGFVRGTPFFSTQIALAHGDEFVLGVSSAPVYDELAWAVRGAGAWLDGARIRVSEVSALAAATLSAGNLASLARSPRWERYGALVGQVERVRGYGDFCHYHLLARGALDIVIESDVNVLDIAALSVIVTEAGGRFTDLEGQPVGRATTSALATNGRLHAAVLQALGCGERAGHER
ncbi:MAG TPA: inositol monophosphatase family protein [Gammaproteobacteria bacterium]|nr:inositol monophosphatase family protein [Gammaproteobacteria bacterium]